MRYHLSSRRSLSTDALEFTDHKLLGISVHSKFKGFLTITVNFSNEDAIKIQIQEQLNKFFKEKKTLLIQKIKRKYKLNSNISDVLFNGSFAFKAEESFSPIKNFVSYYFEISVVKIQNSILLLCKINNKIEGIKINNLQSVEQLLFDFLYSKYLLNSRFKLTMPYYVLNFTFKIKDLYKMDGLLKKKLSYIGYKMATTEYLLVVTRPLWLRNSTLIRSAFVSAMNDKLNTRDKKLITNYKLLIGKI